MKDRKLSKKSYGGAKLLAIKEPGIPWEGILWVKKIKSVEEFMELSEEEANKVIIRKCPHDVPSMCFPTDYPYVRSECKKPGTDSDNCPFLFRYANTGNYNCRLRVKDASDRVYE
jgi:hypothetical protein